MAPIKFEEQLKERLEKRTIQPSTEAWSKLADHLEQQDKKQNHRYIWWLGIAASIVGIILVTTFVFDASESKTMTPTVVDSKNDKKLNDKVSEDILVSQQDAMVNSEAETIMSGEDKTQNDPKPSEAVSPKEETPIKEAIASTDLKKKAPAQDPLETPVNNSDFEDAKLKEVVAEINDLKTENALVTEAEIDSLLKQAERDILTNKLQRSNTRTVDANALLQDVEADLEQSFRSRVFETLLNNYETVKTAVAERNN